MITHLTSDEGKADLEGIGGVSSATAGVILRALVNLEADGGDTFFGEPEFETSDLLRVVDGKGVITLFELGAQAARPTMFSTFLMWVLADLFQELPEVGDVDKPKLVFVFDEAHLLFADASKAFLAQVEQTVKLIRSKGVGVFFCTQLPTDVPNEVLSQLGARIQHALRAFTPDDQKALDEDGPHVPENQGVRPGVRTDLARDRRGDRDGAVRARRPDAGGMDAAAAAALAHGHHRRGRDPLRRRRQHAVRKVRRDHRPRLRLRAPRRPDRRAGARRRRRTSRSGPAAASAAGGERGGTDHEEPGREELPAFGRVRRGPRDFAQHLRHAARR